MKDVTIGALTVGNDRPLTVIAGPCQLESADHAQMIAGKMAEACATAGAQFIFKASYDKANRTSLSGKRGLGLDAGLEILADIRKVLGIPVLTDIHDAEQARIAGAVVDVIQIPAFLCRQTDLLLAAGQTSCVVNVKKGQFLAPWDMANVAEKVASTGNDRILLTER
ncbi:MAG: 3-deoxy-8-phosphooctulonate synthase, partial [Albidovulum sp.]